MPKNISYKKLLEGVEEVIKRGEYPNFLKMINRIQNNYSFRNTLLVYSQFPYATCVKGFCDWKKHGRGVKKLNHKIYIYVPIKKKKTSELEGQQTVDGKEIREKEQISKRELIGDIWYLRRQVYDIRDTYALKGTKRIPFIDIEIESNKTDDLFERLVNISPVPIRYAHISSGAKGYYSPENHEIVLQEDLSQDDKTHILIHELCHCLYDDFNYKNERYKSETFVESVSFLVADHFGLDLKTYSFEYIVAWIQDDINEFLKLTDKIEKVSKNYINLIEQNEFKQEKISA